MLTLAAGGWTAVVRPAIGGAIAALACDGVDILRPAVAGADAPLMMGSFPLVPYANRIADGAFGFAGRAYRLPRNFGDHPHALHGIGWQVPWTVLEADDGAVVLEQVHDGGTAWPFAYRAVQTITLTPDGLDMALTVENRSGGAAPIGIGFHPYFVAPAGTRLTAAVGSMWDSDADCLPVARVAGTRFADWPGGADVEIGGLLDHVFGAWDGVARILRPDLDRAIVLRASDTLGMVHLYHPPGADFLCVEPVGHMPDAINRVDMRGEEAMPVLADGATIGGRLSIRLTDRLSA